MISEVQGYPRQHSETLSQETISADANDHGDGSSGRNGHSNKDHNDEEDDSS